MPVSMVSLLRRRRGVNGVPTDDDLDRIACEEGLEIIEWPFKSGLRELYCDGVLALRAGLSRPWRRWLIAHGLVHHVLHVGSQLDCTMGRLTVQRQERMADLAAGYLLWDHMLQTGKWMTPYQLAEAAEVPQECVEHWCHLRAEAAVETAGMIAASN